MICRHLKIKVFCVFILTLGFVNALDFSKCREFYINNSKEFANTMAIHIGNGNYLAYSSIPLDSKSLIKKDDFLGLYLFKDMELNGKFIFNNIHKSIPVKAINKDSIINGEILQKQQSFNKLAIFSKNIDENSIISDICYQIYGISAGNNKFIDKKYIDIFLKAKNIAYSYISIFVVDGKDGVIVSDTNPLINTGINIGDIILKVNDKNIVDSNDFVDTITLLKPDSNVKITIKRDSKILTLEVKTIRRNVRFSDDVSFLEAFGIVLNKDLVVLKNIGKTYFKEGDRILRVNQIKVDSIQALNKAIATQKKDELSLLILRNKFELFITLN
ncbi:PDZ domain-containing protein [Helicobacter sp. 16-1353]|uniref:DUF7488 domain-containing protein n=1 Tax=Helicobacter sp. 16-1353 TaxID=2004996 RepID=UPI0011BD8BE5|nr:PDZ domain-containing protein [Helicobacter sp. 16-1353]